MKKKTTEEFIEQSREIHNDRYDYTITKYTKATEKVRILCKVHGEFLQSPRDHLKGSGCPKCSGKGLSTEDWIKRFNTVHGDKFDYSQYSYTSICKKEPIICKEHGIFFQNTHNHSQGQQCPQCSRKDAWVNNSYYNITNAIANKDEWQTLSCTLYVVRMYTQEENFYKIGITSQSLSRRFRAHDLEYTVEEVYTYETNRYEAILLENKLHTQHVDVKYMPKTKFRGHTECFTTYKGNLID